MNWVTWIFVGIGGLGGLGAIAQVIALPRTLKKVKAEAVKTEAEAVHVVSSTAVAMLEPARKQIDELNERLARANARANDLESQLSASQTEAQDLRNQLKQMSDELAALREENSHLRGTTAPGSPL